MSSNLSRRALIQAPLAAAALSATSLAQEPEARQARKGRIRQAGVSWCYGEPLPVLAKVCQKLGLHGIDVVGPEHFPLLVEHGLVCTLSRAVGPGIGIGNGLNRKEHHEAHFEAIKSIVDKNAEYGFKNVLLFSGNRHDNLPDKEGLENCAEALRQIAPYVEEKGQVLQMELLNSKHDHHGYMFDNTPWGLELVQKVGSPAFKILYDIYHAQIMEGDIIQTIRDHHESFGHYHTAGVPGRSNIDETQELYYPAIMEAIAETGADHYVAHEFRPRGDKLKALTNAVEICDV